MDVNQKYTSLLNEQIAKIGKECRYLEFKSNCIRGLTRSRARDCS